LAWEASRAPALLPSPRSSASAMSSCS
jgi:hypothetical protein